MLYCPPRAGDSVLDPHEPAAAWIGAADSVVAYFDCSIPWSIDAFTAPERLGSQRLRPVVVLLELPLRRAERDGVVHEPLLRAIVQVPDDAAAGCVGLGEQPRSRGGELVPTIGQPTQERTPSAWFSRAIGPDAPVKLSGRAGRPLFATRAATFVS